MASSACIKVVKWVAEVTRRLRDTLDGRNLEMVLQVLVLFYLSFFIYFLLEEMGRYQVRSLVLLLLTYEKLVIHFCIFRILVYGCTAQFTNTYNSFSLPQLEP